MARHGRSPALPEGSGMPGVARCQTGETATPPRPRCRSLAPASCAPRSAARPSGHRSIAPYDIYILPFTTQIKHCLSSPLPKLAFKSKVTFCVQGVISPLLANIFLHYALDLWIHQWRRRHASGRVSIVRYADDFVMGFEKAADARRMLVDLKDRLAKFGLALHEDKTRLIEFGRLPALQRQQRGERRPETFAFLGFTHYCGWTRDGRFIVKHKTQSKRLTRKLTALRQEGWQ